MQAYFSHSYRDVPINTYFSDLFTTAGIALRADQKTDVWCTAKLERYLFEMDGFVSIIPRRIAADESITYSPYIARELMLARRSRAERILFVDGQLLTQFPSHFPPWAMPFFHEEPGTERGRHIKAIDDFRRTLGRGRVRAPRSYSARRATVIGGGEPVLRDGANHVAAILRSEGYSPAVKYAASMDEAFDGIDVFESILDSELCVFVLGRDLSYSDLYLAMAHAHCVPSVRLRHDPAATSADPELSGVVRWTSPGNLKPQFLKVFQNYLSAFERPAGEGDLQRIATPITGGGEWDPADGPGLLAFIRPENAYVSDRAAGVMNGIEGAQTGRTRSDQVCRGLYDRIRKDRFYYTFEPAISQPVVQRIRTPDEIDALNCGTCLDFACLFAALLEAAHEQPVIAVTRSRRGAHAVAGYFAPDAVTWDEPATLGDLRGALKRGELVLFEATGAVEVRGRTVAAETDAERNEGGDMLDYRTAKTAAARLLWESDIELQHFVDVRQLRQHAK
ncbi:MAG: hypothetical protein ABIU95_15670 [Burkholderiales bacterium]